MKKIVLLLLTVLATKCYSQTDSLTSTKIDSLMTAVYNRGQFTGAILVSNNGKLVYQKAFGMANREKNIPFTLATQEYIGSISKQFTAMGIMILKDRGKLAYNQSVKDFFPELSACMQPVTVTNLLYHTSGLALFDDYPDMTEKDVFNILVKQDSLRFTPGEKFEYCNAGYSLLGMIIEKVSGQSLNDFMTENIFKPLGMLHTQVNEITHRDTARAVGYTLFGTINSYDTFMGGNASVISTVGDLYKWQQSLYHFKLVKPKTLKEGLKPSNKVLNNPALLLKDNMFGDKSYAFGWWVDTQDNSADYFHDGAFSGYIAYIERMAASQTSIIGLSNLRQPYIYDIRQAIVNILQNKPYSLPKILGSVWLNQKISAIGADAAISQYKALVASADTSYDFTEVVLNSYAYVLLRGNRVQDAIKVFKLNTELYPNSFNVYDSLADGYEKAGDKAQAIECCKKALQIDPTSDYMKQRLQALQTGN